MKYPHILIEETLSADGQRISVRAMAADHIMVDVSADGEAAFAEITDRIGARVIRRIPKTGIRLIEFPDAGIDTVSAGVAAYVDVPGVESAEPDYLHFALATIPNDSLFGQLWGMQNNGTGADIDAPEAWDVTTGSAGVLVCVIDTGIDYNHPDLAANAWVNPGEIPGNNVDDDNNGYVDDIYGYDFVNNDANPWDDHGHGTHVSGTIGGVGNNSTGVAGVNWTVKIAGAKFLDSGGSGWDSDAISAIYYATSIGVDLTCNSWGGGGGSQSLKNAIDNADANGILFMAAAGNDGWNNDSTPHYPSSFSSANIISVAATTYSDGLAGFSNYGSTSVDLGAPGEGITSTLPNNQYQAWSGTSMATPHVAGAAALIKAHKPSLTHSQIKTILMSSVDPISALSGKSVTGGRLNVFKALDEIAIRPAAPSNLVAQVAGSAVNLFWTDTATNEQGFVVERKEGVATAEVPDESGQGNHGTMKPSIVGGPTWTGSGGGAYDFDGSDDHIDIGNDSSVVGLTPSAATIEAWVYNTQPVATGGIDLRTVVGQRDNGQTRGYGLQYGSLLVHYIFVGFYGGVSATVRDIEIPANQWVHLVGVLQNNQGTIYIDGQAQATVTAGSGYTSSSDEVMIGRMGN